MRTERGALFKKYPYGKFPEYKEVIFNFHLNLKLKEVKERDP